jgi:hypothetical protein
MRSVTLCQIRQGYYIMRPLHCFRTPIPTSHLCNRQTHLTAPQQLRQDQTCPQPLRQREQPSSKPAKQALADSTTPRSCLHGSSTESPHLEGRLPTVTTLPFGYSALKLSLPGIGIQTTVVCAELERPDRQIPDEIAQLRPQTLYPPSGRRGQRWSGS